MSTLPLSGLTAISPIDGRYRNKVDALSNYYSEFALIRYRVIVEVRWLQCLAAHPQVTEAPSINAQGNAALESLIENFSLADAQRVKDIEATTNHDVKAVEYFIKEKVSSNADLAKQMEFVHFACTSEDINNLSYALML